MWLLFHRKAGTKVVVGGTKFREECPTCERTTNFEEIEIGESYGVFFVDIVGDRERAFRCRQCGDVFDLRDQPARTAPTERVERVDRVEQLAAEQRERDAAKAAEKGARATRIEDELAELKRRMGK